MKFSITGDENSLDVSFTLDDGSVLSKHYNGEDHFSASTAKDDSDSTAKNDSASENINVGSFFSYANSLWNLQRNGHEVESPKAQFDYIDAGGNISNVKVDLRNLVDASTYDCFTIRRDDGSYRKYRYDRIIDGVVKMNNR